MLRNVKKVTRRLHLHITLHLMAAAVNFFYWHNGVINVPVIIINPPPSAVVLRGGLLGQGLGARVAIINLWPCPGIVLRNSGTSSNSSSSN